MCTLIILRRPDNPWPTLIAANRDEMVARPWRPPARHWPDRPETIAGIDLEAGGSWLGMNDHGVVAGILNRPQTLGPDPMKRSRGEIVLDALDHADAAEAAEALAALDPAAYRPFNLVIADNRDAWWLRSEGEAGPGRVERFEVPEGLSMFTARDRNDTASTRIALYLPRFQAEAAPDPEAGDWQAWEALLSAKEKIPGGGEDGAMRVETDVGFATMSSSLIALPGADTEDKDPVWRFCDRAPEPGGYTQLDLS
jgi:hypothetical protein